MGVPIERHAQFIYTRAMYEKFCDELFESGKFAIKEKLPGEIFLLEDTMTTEDAQSKWITVRFISPEVISCECGLFEHMGMLCRHAIKVRQL